MNVLVLAHGTLGDVRPFAALAIALNNAGHTVTLAGPPEYEHLTAKHPIHYSAIGLNWGEIIIGNSTVRNIGGRHYPITSLLVARRRLRYIRSFAIESMSSLVDIDFDIVVHRWANPGHELAEKLGVPAIPTLLAPDLIPVSSFPHPAFPPKLPRIFNRASYEVRRLYILFVFGGHSKWRRSNLGLASRRRHSNVLIRPDGSDSTVLQAFSKHIFSPSPRYPNHVNTTGFWFMPESGLDSVPNKLLSFVSDGEPVIYVGFGSTRGNDPGRNSRIVSRAIRQLGVRTVVVGGYGGLNPNLFEQEDILYLENAPLEFLFPHMAAIVHHGGSGTTGIALASGRPQVICPNDAHQRFYADCMHLRRVAPKPQHINSLSADELTESIRFAITDPILERNARDLGFLIRSEGGIAKAIQVIESNA